MKMKKIMRVISMMLFIYFATISSLALENSSNQEDA